MIYRRLEDNDYSFGQGSNGFLSQVEAVAQAIVTRLKLLKNEWWENLNEGTPLWQQVLGAHIKDMKIVDKIFLTRVKGTKGVKSVTDYQSSFNSDTRHYEFQCTVDTEYGQTTVEVSI